jgi:hypothetical protein
VIGRSTRAREAATSGLLFVCPRITALVVALALPAAVSAACDFPPVQKQIDQVLTDREKGEAFRKEVKSSFDSLDVMDKYFPAELKDKLDACRYEAGEYLTKRGFPPGH